MIIDGLGGYGKTAIANQLVQMLSDHGRFDYIIVESAKQEVLEGEEIVSLENAILSFDSLLNSIARQLNRWDLPHLDEIEKKSKIKEIFLDLNLLLFIDNIETIDNIYSLVCQIKELDPTKVLITSRKKFNSDSVYSLSLKPLNIIDTELFVKKEASKKQVFALNDLDHRLLERLHQSTGGAPLAIKLAVAQAKFLDLQIILDNLERAGSELYPYVFKKTWEQLSEPSKKLLIYIGRTVITSVSWVELQNSTVIESDSDLKFAITQLFDYSLLDSALSIKSYRYSIHQLTRYFINSDLPRYWSNQ